MAIAYNPKIVTNGLVLALDAANPKSYQSKENLLTYTNSIGDANYAGNGTVYLNDSIAPDGSFTATKYDQIDSANNYRYGGAPNGLTVNTIYTYSIHIKQGNTSTFQVTIDENGFGGKRYFVIFTYATETLSTGISGLANDGEVLGSTFKKLENGWYRIGLTFRTSTTTVNGFVDMIARFSGPGIHYFWGRQLERNSSMSDYTATTNTTITRGTTWNDLSGNGYHASIYNNPGYNSDTKAIVLDNTDDYISLNSNLNLETLGASYNYTIMFGAKKLFYGTGGNNNGNSNLLTASNNGYSLGWRIHEDNQGTPGNAFSGAAYYSIGAPDLGSAISISDTVANRTSIVAFARSSTQFFAFLNGNTKTEVETNTSYVNGTNLGNIGSPIAGVGKFAGNIHFIVIYNRALSAAEIQQNYNAIRGRFGL